MQTQFHHGKDVVTVLSVIWIKINDTCSEVEVYYRACFLRILSCFISSPLITKSPDFDEGSTFNFCSQLNYLEFTVFIIAPRIKYIEST